MEANFLLAMTSNAIVQFKLVISLGFYTINGGGGGWVSASWWQHMVAFVTGYRKALVGNAELTSCCANRLRNWSCVGVHFGHCVSFQSEWVDQWYWIQLNWNLKQNTQTRNELASPGIQSPIHLQSSLSCVEILHILKSKQQLKTYTAAAKVCAFPILLYCVPGLANIPLPHT